MCCWCWVFFCAAVLVGGLGWECRFGGWGDEDGGGGDWCDCCWCLLVLGSGLGGGSSFSDLSVVGGVGGGVVVGFVLPCWLEVSKATLVFSHSSRTPSYCVFFS